MKELIGNLIIIFLTISIVSVILIEIYFIVCIIRNKILEKKYANDIELQKRLRKENEIFWKNRNFRSI